MRWRLAATNAILTNVETHTKQFNPAPYMRWAKTRPKARYDLAMSNLLPCTPDEVPGLLDDVPVNGLNPHGCPELIEAISTHYGVATDQIALGTGGSGTNFLACAALLGPGDDAVVESPVYDPLTAAAQLVGAAIIRFDRTFEEDWFVHPERVAEVITDRTRLIITSSPHNPTGVAMPPAVVRALGELAENQGAWVLVDEVYRDTKYGPAIPLAATIHPRCISVNSFTKSHGLFGLRCGWAIAAPEVAERIRIARDATEGVGVYAAELASARVFAMIDRLEDRAHAIIAPNLERVRRFMESRDDIEWVPPDAGTVAFPRFADGRETTDFTDTLLRDHDTAVVPGHFFGEPSHFRIAFGVSADTLEGGLHAIETVLS